MLNVKIGTRGSQLALHQASRVQDALAQLGVPAELVVIQTKGDRIQDRPLQSMGTGIFTKALDDALLAGEVDLAVHSMKDVPTQLLEPMEAWAVLERGLPGDVLVGHDPSSTVVATGSIRRKAQWLHRHPDHTSVGLRGNVETRLAKVKSNPWRGGIFAAAGLDRLGLLEGLEGVEHLDWMVPAPAQGSDELTPADGSRIAMKTPRLLNEEELAAIDPEVLARAQVEELVRSDPERVTDILKKWATETERLVKA